MYVCMYTCMYVCVYVCMYYRDSLVFFLGCLHDSWTKDQIRRRWAHDYVHYGKPIVAIFNTIIQFQFNEIQVQFNENSS